MKHRSEPRAAIYARENYLSQPLRDHRGRLPKILRQLLAEASQIPRPFDTLIVAVPEVLGTPQEAQQVVDKLMSYGITVNSADERPSAHNRDIEMGASFMSKLLAAALVHIVVPAAAASAIVVYVLIPAAAASPFAATYLLTKNVETAIFLPLICASAFIGALGALYLLVRLLHLDVGTHHRTPGGLAPATQGQPMTP